MPPRYPDTDTERALTEIRSSCLMDLRVSCAPSELSSHQVGTKTHIQQNKNKALGSPDETHTEQPNAPIHNQQQACHPVLTREPRGDGKFLLAQLSHVLITSYQFLSSIYKQEKLLQSTQACAALPGTSSGPSICCSAGNSHPVSHTPEPFVTLSSG